MFRLSQLAARLDAMTARSAQVDVMCDQIGLDPAVVVPSVRSTTDPACAVRYARVPLVTTDEDAAPSPHTWELAGASA